MTTLERVQQLVDQLTPVEQVRLLEYLTPRIARAIVSTQPAEEPLQTASANAWQEFFRIGDALAATDTSDSATLTATVLAMRR